MSLSVDLDSPDPTRSSSVERLHKKCINLTRPIALIGALGMLVAAGSVVVDVMLRWLFSMGVIALNEVIAMTFTVAVTACIPAGIASGVGVTIDVIEKGLGSRVNVWLKSLGAISLLAVLALLTWRLAIYAGNLTAQGRTTIILGLPQGPFLWAAALLIGIATVVQGVVAAHTIRLSILYRSPSRGPLDAMVWVISGALIVAAVALAVYFEPVSRWVVDHPGTTVVIGILLMWLLMLGMIPLAATLAIVGLVGAALLIGSAPAMSGFATEVSGLLTDYQMAMLPLFLMMGSFAAVAGVSDDVYRLAQAVLGRFRGGLAMATIGGCTGFGMVTGSSLATVATFGRISLPQMEARGYPPHFAAGCVAAGGTLGALLPPSGPLIIYALLTESSIGHLFVAALLPALLTAILYLLTIAIVVRRNPDLVPMQEKADSGELWVAIRKCGPVFLLFGSVIGGMYSGVFTSTEAAAVGAFGAFVVALLRGKLRADRFLAVMTETTASVALIYTIIFGVLVFSFFVGASGFTEAMTALVSTLDLPAVVIIGLILIAFLLLGSIMDSFTIMIVTVPIIAPVILFLGYDLVWWGIINLVVVEIGLITPPFGLHLFVLKTVLPKVSLMKMYEGVLPFCVSDFVKLFLIVLFPAIALWLPSTMR
jgi:tripartite ATP-independent transporter DctM subunit